MARPAASSSRLLRASARALEQLRDRDITRLVVIGGNGSQAGAHALSRQGLAVVGVASTIDNDLVGSDITIGATTAIDVALESVDRLRVTASSHHRGFLVEVMGRACGYLATIVGIAGGAEAIVVPEEEPSPKTSRWKCARPTHAGKSHAIVVVAEGARLDADALASYFKVHGNAWASNCAYASSGTCSAAAPPA